MADKPSNDRPIEIHCTKENPWNKVPPKIGKEVITHDDAKETYPEYDGSIVAYKCPNCGHEFTIDMS